MVNSRLVIVGEKIRSLLGDGREQYFTRLQNYPKYLGSTLDIPSTLGEDVSVMSQLSAEELKTFKYNWKDLHHIIFDTEYKEKWRRTALLRGREKVDCAENL